MDSVTQCFSAVLLAVAVADVSSAAGLNGSEASSR